MTSSDTPTPHVALYDPLSSKCLACCPTTKPCHSFYAHVFIAHLAMAAFLLSFTVHIPSRSHGSIVSLVLFLLMLLTGTNKENKRGCACRRRRLKSYREVLQASSVTNHRIQVPHGSFGYLHSLAPVSAS